jgi:hypothetical protein
MATLRRRDCERFDLLESSPGEEAQLDLGEDALTRTANGKYRRPFLFVMTLKCSGKISARRSGNPTTRRGVGCTGRRSGASAVR